ncbi:MarR family winged helix-turn-helix transcriptional regulator [Micromonospora tarensis]|uniref:Winged helix DNA-binding protein n=1 Tax=Micromonospora tarensis TaxID=2806100 RepID=A0ABS1YB43_9ACTN|nr:MarR family transcriptional regulator [Micromonospora tarensis]MBM0274624.1 winged helix DNA-binding protein [Micromonospora tarensis]
MRSSETISSATGYLLLRLANLASARMEEALLPFRLRGRDLRVLAFVQDGELSQRDLSQQTGLDRTTMVAVIDGLERNGYVRRERSPTDRRKQLISVTTDGRTVLSEALTALRWAEDGFLAPLGEDERRQLHRQLSLLYAAHDPRCQTDDTSELGLLLGSDAAGTRHSEGPTRHTT